MAAPVEVFDEHYFVLGAIVTVAFQLACFAVAWRLRVDTLTDLAGSANFVLLALLALFLGGRLTLRPVVLTSLLCASRLELASFLLYRVCKRKRDARFDEMRESFGAFLGFWVFQMFWAFVVTMPVMFVNSDAASAPPTVLEPADIVGWALFGVGFAVQVVADLTKYKFRADPANRGKFCAVGVWRWSRHPNYFGEMLLVWGLFVGSLPVITRAENTAAGWLTVLSPLFTMLILLFVSGLPTAEGAALARFYTA
eukprot:SAG22_NODE_2353_length_2674_cov_1.846990_2_plen_253_part_01